MKRTSSKQGVLARCQHCTWGKRFSELTEAVEAAIDHADYHVEETDAEIEPALALY